MKILITGGKGLLGRNLEEELGKDHKVILVDIDSFDICSLEQTESFFDGNLCDLVVHCAAYTNTEMAETETEAAFNVNADGTKNMAEACKKRNIPLVYLSTDYVFDGSKRTPYATDDDCFLKPLNVYGKSKLLGEEHVKNICDKYFIVRTSWLYGKYGKNFVSTMLRLAQTHDTLKVVSDQIGRPTYAPHLSCAISKLIETDAYGIYHISNNGQCSWYEFAAEIFMIADLEITVEPVTSQEYGSKAVRPHWSVMDLTKTENLLGYEMQNWRVGLEEYIKAIKKQ